MISQKMNEAFNAQINAEFFSSYLYLSMSAWLAQNKLSGLSNWMRAQAQEELFHATKMYDYLLERGGIAQLTTIKAPQSTWESPLQVMEDVVAHEKMVTDLINNMVDIALAERDHAANIFLQWYVEEQVEEEASVGDVLDKMKLIQNDSAGLFALDMELGKRTFTLPEE